MSLNRNILTTFLTQFPVIILSFITGLFITRTIGVEGKGVYAIFSANIQLLALFTGFSINSGLVYFIASKKIRFNKILGISFYVFILAIILGIVVVFIPIGIENILFPDGYFTLYFKLYLFLSYLITLINTIFIGIFQGKKEYSIINKIAIINGVLNAFVFTIIYFTNYFDVLENKLENVFLFSLIVILLNTLFFFISYIKRINITPILQIDFNTELKPFLNYIGVGHLSNIINFFNYRLDIWFVNNYHGIKQLGLYSLAVNVSQMLLIISTPISTVLFPYLTEIKEKRKRIELMSAFSRFNTFALFIGLVLFYLLGDFLIPILYGVEFTESIQSFKIMIFAVFFMGLTKVLSVYLGSENLVKYNLYATIIGLFVTLVLDIILIPIYGIYGAAIASLLTYFSILVFVIYKVNIINSKSNINLFIINLSDITVVKKYLKNGR